MPIIGAPLAGPFDLSAVLVSGLSEKSDAEALVSRRQRWTWRWLDETSNRLASAYLDLGLKPGDRVASLMPNRTELIVHYIACLKAGFVAVPLNYRYMAPEIDHALAVAEPRVLLAHDERAADLALSSLAGKLPLGLISYSDEGGGGSMAFRELCKGAGSRAIERPKPADPAIIFFTSGSTGKPKGVCHSFETLGWIIANAIQGFEIGPDDVMLPGGSISHVGGHHLTFMTLAAAGRVVIARTFDGEEILPLLREERPTKMWMLPSALYALTRDHDARHADFDSVKVCYSGGDKVSEALEREFTALAGIPIDEDYGMTEMGIPTVNPVGGNRIGSVGRLTAGYQASLRDEAGSEVPLGDDGRLWIKFPGTMVGYWNDPDATAEVFVEGWLDTGDLMAADADDYFWFRGRKKQIIIHDGSNICPQEVEGALLEHPAVADAGVVGVHHVLHGENVRAYVTLEPGAARPTSQDLIRFARDRVGYKAPEEIVVLDAMPLNATGKVDRVTLKRIAEPD
jgi:acyl-coenzyme A synthetase/AMP-(fatty) acid ligase